MKRYRVVHWGTGNVGSVALKAMLERPDYEIVGQFAWSPEKVGKDIGELIGLPPVGIQTTDDVDQLIALEPDVLVWCGNASFDPLEAARSVARFLEAGVNVVTPGLYEIGSEESAPQAFLDIILPACQRGRSSIYSTGADPGFATSQLAATCYTAAHRVDEVRLQEFADYGQYPDEKTLRQMMGFGGPLDASTPLSSGEMATRVWRNTIDESARMLGLEVESYHTIYRTAPALTDRDTLIGRIEKGTVSVLWFQVIGVVDGRDRIVLEHTNWMHLDDIPEDFPTPPKYRGGQSDVGYRISIRGEPSFDVEVQFPGIAQGLAVTALHTTNAIPTVVAADPGIVSQVKIPPYGPRPLKPHQ